MCYHILHHIAEDIGPRSNSESLTGLIRTPITSFWASSFLHCSVPSSGASVIAGHNVTFLDASLLKWEHTDLWMSWDENEDASYWFYLTIISPWSLTDFPFHQTFFTNKLRKGWRSIYLSGRFHCPEEMLAFSHTNASFLNTCSKPRNVFWDQTDGGGTCTPAHQIQVQATAQGPPSSSREDKAEGSFPCSRKTHLTKVPWVKVGWAGNRDHVTYFEHTPYLPVWTDDTNSLMLYVFQFTTNP